MMMYILRSRFWLANFFESELISVKADDQRAVSVIHPNCFRTLLRKGKKRSWHLGKQATFLGQGTFSRIDPTDID